MFSVFVCDSCPLYFKVGGYVFWGSPGREEQVVCYGCGTMHRLIEEGKTCRVFSLPGPVRAIEATESPAPEWRQVGKATGIDDWRKLCCSVCHKVGLLRSRERLPRQDEYPEDPLCPLCSKPARCVMVYSVN